MKLLCVGDAHLRSSTPAKRKDDFAKTQHRKMTRIFEIGAENEAVILMTGDVFDSDTSSLGTLVRYLPMFRKYKYGIYTAVGNHDIYGTSLHTIERSALGLFVVAGAVGLLGHIPVLLDSEIAVTGHSYMHDGRPRPIPGQFNVLVTHEMILEDKIWKEQEDFIYAHDYAVENSGWDLVLCGHYHASFERKVGDCLLVNPGAVVRIKASKFDFRLQPGVVLYDTDTRQHQRILLGAEPVENVFVQEIAKPAVPAAVAAFVDALTPELRAEMGTGALHDVVMRVLKDSGCRTEVCDLVRSYHEKAVEG